jgi:hypothetical protein
LDDDTWTSLHTRARREKTTISHLVREAIREKYSGTLEKRRQAMRKFVGIRQDWPDSLETDTYLRDLRRDSRSLRVRPK